ncbi:MAG: Lrp/AsnC family transcriptional regulator, partial [Muribaculum intestinale]|nr:Lrp/AsnC family transcriptional regulator [Muribaculum intestinale]
MSSTLTEMLDSIDIDILRALQTDARLSTRQLAAKVHRSPTPVFERLKRLEAQGY